MRNISVRGLDDDVHEALRRRAARAGRSMEAEVRKILTEAIADSTSSDPFEQFMRHAQAAGGVDLEPPPNEFESRIDREPAAFE